MKHQVEKRLCLHAYVSLNQWNKPFETAEILAPLEALAYFNLPCVTVENDSTTMKRTMLETSLSVSTSIEDKLKLKQQEVLDNFQVKTAG